MTIAIIAHDGRKAKIAGFIKDHINLFKRKNINLLATGTTGSHLERAGLEVEKNVERTHGRRRTDSQPTDGGQSGYGYFFSGPTGQAPTRSRCKYAHAPL